MTRTSAGARSSSAATVIWVAVIPWVVSCRISRPSSQSAVAADVSMGLWWLAAKRYVASISHRRLGEARLHVAP